MKLRTKIEEMERRAQLSCTKERKTDQTPWDVVVSVLKTHYYEPDVEAARVLYSGVAAHDLKGQPVWPMAVAPPGSMKTELIRALDRLDRVHSIDAVTSKTFISVVTCAGERGQAAGGG